MKLEVILIVSLPNPADPLQTKFLFLESGTQLSLPGEILNENESSLQCAENMLDSLTGLRGWVKLEQKKIVDNPSRIIDGERALALPYLVIIPADTLSLSRKDVRQLSIEEFVDREFVYDHKEILFSMSH